MGLGMSDCHVLMSWSDGSQTFPNPREYSGVSGRPVDSAWVDPLRASLATNVVFPARADQVRLSGRTVIFPHSVSPTEPFVVPSAAANENTTLMLVQRGVCVVVRVIRADAVSLADTVRIELQADTDSLPRNAARLAIYHYRGDKRMLHGSVKVALAFAIGPCVDPASFLSTAERMTAASTVDSDGIWTSTLRWDKAALGGNPQEGELTVVRRTSESGFTSKVLRRTYNGVEVQMPISELVVNGKPLSFLPEPPQPNQHAVPTDPKALARLVGDAFFREAKPPGVNEGMLRWNYGAALILDGMFESVRQFGFHDWVPKIDAYMDAYTLEKSCRGYKLAHNITMPWDRAVGDLTGLFPITFLQRALYNKDLHGADMSIANLTADHYILQWPKRLQDGTFSRQVGWPNETSTETGSFVW